jgi:hypothetical protein
VPCKTLQNLHKLGGKFTFDLHFVWLEEKNGHFLMLSGRTVSMPVVIRFMSLYHDVFSDFAADWKPIFVPIIRNALSRWKVLQFQGKAGLWRHGRLSEWFHLKRIFTRPPGSPSSAWWLSGDELKVFLMDENCKMLFSHSWAKHRVGAPYTTNV